MQVVVVVMAQQAASLQNYNQELVKCVEDLRKQSRELGELIEKEQQEKSSIEKDIQALHMKLSLLDGNLTKHVALKQEYDRAISETEAAYTKILESSQVLLNMVRREAACLEKAKNIPNSSRTCVQGMQIKDSSL